MTWWPGRGRTLDHPAVQRLLAAAAEPASVSAVPAGASEDGAAGPDPDHDPGAAGDGSQPMQQKAVLLFVRAGSSPYVFCGRLKLAALNNDSTNGGFRVGWELRDSHALLASQTFQGLLSHCHS